VQCRFAVEGFTIRASIRTPGALAAAELELERTDHEKWRHVRVRRRSGASVKEISNDVYSVAPVELP
jgi:hypothetical protein